MGGTANAAYQSVLQAGSDLVNNTPLQYVPGIGRYGLGGVLSSIKSNNDTASNADHEKQSTVNAIQKSNDDLFNQAKQDRQLQADSAVAAASRTQARQNQSSASSMNNGTLLTSPLGTPNANPTGGGGKTLLGS